MDSVNVTLAIATRVTGRMMYRVEDLLNLKEYPLNQPMSGAYSRLVAAKQEDWRTIEVFGLPGLLRCDAAHAAAEELRQPMDTISFRHRQAHNIYFSSDTDVLPQDLAVPSLVTAHSTLTCDQLVGTIIRSLYEYDPLRAFIQCVFGLSELYRMSDPMACVNVMAYSEGNELGWHFDRAKFAVTILLQAAKEGGQFEYRRQLRTAVDPNYTGVRRLLEGRDDSVRQSASAPGDLTVFAGFESAHRVTPVIGDTPRTMAVLSYMSEPDCHCSPQDRMRFYGRRCPEEPPRGRHDLGTR